MSRNLDCNCNFTHLHLHTDASLRDGLGTVPRMVAQAKVLGFGALAMTDHGTLANAISFSIECKRAGIKPLIGLEGYVEEDGEIGHITLLADGNKGFNSLLKLNNIAHHSTFSQPAFTIPQLINNSDGLICLTGCIASPLQQAPFRDAVRIGYHLKRAFGNKLFAEMMFVGADLNPRRALKLAEHLNIKPVITNDVHFPFQSDGEIHPILTIMKSAYEYESKQLFLRSPQEMFDAAIAYGVDPDDAKEYLERAWKIGRLIETPKLEHQPHLPAMGATRESIIDLFVESRKELLGDPAYQERFEYEMGILVDLDFLDYFAILHDIIKKAEELKVQRGAARGSGAGCLILFLMGITDIDPIRFGLQFERFLNPLRKGFPDVDIDFESERRELVLEYAADQYGAVPIATYSKYSHKSLTRDLGKHFKQNEKLINQAADEGENSDAFKELAKVPLFMESYEAFLGQIRHKGKHAGGIVITDQDVPIERIAKEVHAAAWTEGQNSELSYAGLVKFDLLGLSALSALREMSEETGVPLADFPMDDHPVFKLFQEGRLSGVFQFSGSEGIRQLTMKLQPRTFMELVAINALYRPGAIDAGALDNYPKWKENPREVPAYIADVLEETYGAVIYQEQFMEIYRRTVSGSLADADQARRIIVKNKLSDPAWKKKFILLRDQFVEGAQEHGLSLKKARSLWGELATHTRYSFNKSHAVSYTLIAWQTAVFKFYYPAVFYAAMLNHDSTQEQTYILDAISDGIRISPPNVNKSGDSWKAGDDEIFMPISAVRFLGETGAQSIQNLRGSGFSTIQEFMDKVPKRLVRSRAREGLLMLGAFHNGKSPVGSLLEESAELLQLATPIDELEEFVGNRIKTTFHYLGFVLPDAELLERLSKLEEDGFETGTIKSREIRNKGKGNYAVYKISPSGAFWTNDVMDLEKGEVIGFKVGKSGKALKIRRVK